MYYANEQSDDVIDGSTKTIKYWEYLQKYWRSDLQTSHQNCYFFSFVPIDAQMIF